MKVMNKWHKLGLCILVSFVFGCIGALISNNVETKTINGIEQEFPIQLDDRFEVINASLNEYEFTLLIKDTSNGDEYESMIPTLDFEEFVCDKTIMDSDGEHKEWDCSTEENTLTSMIKEFGNQTIELIKESE